MIYGGLLDEDGDEITVKGYGRIDLTSYEFRIGPTEAEGYQVAFAIDEMIKFGPVGGHCYVAMFAMWKRRTGGKPFARGRLLCGISELWPRDSLVIPPMSLVFPMRGLPFDRKVPKAKHARAQGRPGGRSAA